MNDKLEQLNLKYGEVADIRATIALLEWDQEVYMPPKGGEARGRQIATLSALAHRLFTDPQVGALLYDLAAAADALEPDARRMVEETLYDYERATRLPESFVHALAEAQSRAFQAWVDARKASSFPQFLPHLERILALQKQKADLVGYAESPYNALLEDYERGMTAAQLKTIFDSLRPQLAELTRRIVQSPRQADLSWLALMQDDAAKWEFTLRLLRDMGYDFGAGRQDRSPHPFTTNFDIDDVRVTTRILPKELFWFSSLHEGGHALYEQGFPKADRRTVLASAPSLGIHESQSRMWENIIGRSLPFWKHYTPVLQSYFPGALESLTPDIVYRTVNHTAPSLIRTESDECTYNLHVILRFEIELDLIEGRITPRDVPELWNTKMQELLGVAVPDDARGCLQDVHWSHGAFGYFPTYSLGNLYSAQLFDAAQRDMPALWQQIEQADFAPLLQWLRRNIHEVGRRKTAAEIVEDVTGQPPHSGPFVAYLKNKYEALYEL